MFNVWRFIALAGILGLLLDDGLSTTFITFATAHPNQFGRASSVLPLRRLQDSSEATGCRWTQSGCIASGAYYAETGAFYEYEILVKELEQCLDPASSDCDIDKCKTIETDEGTACVNQASNMNSASKEDLKNLLALHRSLEGFSDTCPLTDALDGDASTECQGQWSTMVNVTGCESCVGDLAFFKDELTAACSKQDQGSCESAQGTTAAGQAVCSHAQGSAAESAAGMGSHESGWGKHAGTQQACTDGESSTEESGLATGAVAGIAIAAIVATIAIAALVAWLILRSPRSRNSKKRAAEAGAVPPVPGADAAAHGMHPGAPYGAQGMPSHQPPLPYGYGHVQQPTYAQAGPTGGGAALGGVPRMVPTDVYPSAEQFMASGPGHESHPPQGSVAGSFYGSAYGGSAYAGSAYGGSAFGGPDAQLPAAQMRDPGEIARLPARDVLVKQIAHTGDPAHMFSISTRAAWDATAAGTMPSPTTTGSSKPEDVLEAQLDYVAHQLSGTLLEDTRVGQWVIAPGLQQRISSRSAVVFVHARDEPESPSATGKQLRALKFYFMKEDFDRNVAASQALELKDLMPVVERVEGDPFNLTMPNVPPPLNLHALPPLIINERGETLDEHVARTQPNFVSALSIMIQLAQVIERLHSVGWVHRDLKPSNCLFLAQPARWALIDWACAAKAGAPADVSFSLYYAPPESVYAYKAGQAQMHSHPSADVWSLGVMAWELFTGRKFYGPAPDLQYVVKVLAGEQPLPTETELPPDIKKRLGNSMFRATFLSMLHRDPQQRPSMRQLLTSWESFFSQTRPN